MINVYTVLIVVVFIVHSSLNRDRESEVPLVMEAGVSCVCYSRGVCLLPIGSDRGK